LVTLALSSCGPAADGTHAGLSSYEPPGGQYRLHYRKPPWKLVEPADEEMPEGDTAVLVIRSNAEKYGDDGGATGAPHKYELTIDTRGGSARNLAQRAARMARRRSGERVLVEPRPIEADDGTTRGWETLTVRDAPLPSLRHRFSYLTRAGGGVVRVRITAVPDLDEPEIDEMIALVEVDPESE